MGAKSTKMTEINAAAASTDDSNSTAPANHLQVNAGDLELALPSIEESVVFHN